MVDLKGFLIYLRNLLHLGCVQYNHDQLHKPSWVLSGFVYFRHFLGSFSFANADYLPVLCPPDQISNYIGTHWRSILNASISVDWNARQSLRAKSCDRTYTFSQFLAVSDCNQGRLAPLPLDCHTYWCTLQYPFWIFVHYYTTTGSN